MAAYGAMKVLAVILGIQVALMCWSTMALGDTDEDEEDDEGTDGSVMAFDPEESELLSLANPNAIFGHHVPKYMLELFKRLDTGEDAPPSDIIRSFVNLKGDIHQDYGDTINNAEWGEGSETRVHILAFNVTALPSHESLQLAELRLHALIRRDQKTFLGVDRLVTVSTIFVDETGVEKHESVESRHIYEKSDAWETFVVTNAVRMWMSIGDSTELRLQVRIDSVFRSVGDPGDLDVEVVPYVATEPLLLIYSTNKVSHTYSVRNHSSPAAKQKRSIQDAGAEEAQEEDTNSINEVLVAPTSKSRRKSQQNPCRRKPLFVNFADINYDNWIIAPRGYEAFECRGKCYFPLSDHLTPTHHAIIQTILHTVSPKKAPRACCVPTKLDSISILYLDNGVVTYKYRHEGMVVTECGCR